MGKSKKHGVEVPVPASGFAGEEKKKGKRGLEEAAEVKSLKKQKVAANPEKETQQSVEKRMTEVKEDKVSKLPSSTKGLQDSKAPIERARAKHKSKGALHKSKTKEVKISAKSAGKLSAKVENQDVSTSEDSSEDETAKNRKVKKQKVEMLKQVKNNVTLPSTKVVKASLKPSLEKVESSDEEDSDEEESSDVPAKTKLKPKLQTKDVKKPTPKPSGKKMESIEESSSSDESSEDEQAKVEKKKVTAPKSKELKKPGLPPTKKMESSSESSSEDSSEDELDEETKAVKPVASSSEESSEDESEEETKVVKQKVDAVKSILQKPMTKVSDVKAFVKKDDSSDESDESDSEEEPLPKQKQFKASLQRAQTQVAKMPAEEESSDETDESDSEEEPNQNTKQVHLKPSLQKPKASVGKTSVKDEESSDDSDESSESDSDKDCMQITKNLKQSFQKVQPPVGKLLAKEEESSDESDESDTSGSEEEPVTQNTKLKPGLQKAKTLAVKAPAKEEESSDETDESDESNSEEEAVQKTKQSMPTKATGKGAANGNIGSAAADDGDDEEEGEDEEEPQPPKTKEKESGKVKKGNQVITPGRGPTPGGGSKTVFVKNLAWSVDEDSVQEFFSDAGEIHEVRLAVGSDGRFRGFGHVEFMSEEGSRKACEKSGHTFAGREIFVDMAQERIFSPSSGGKKDWKSPQDGGFSGSGNQRFSSDSTAFVKGFDKFQDEDTIRSSFMEFFHECGVRNVRIPTDRETGSIKGFAYIDFKDKDALYKAVEYNGSELNGYYLVIEEAGGSGGGGGGRGGRGGRDFGGRGGRGGRGRGDFGDRGRGGRGGGRGGRGSGAPKQKINLSGTGKKTTFGED